MPNYYQHNGTSYVHVSDYAALKARLAEAERERDEWHARAIALFWKGDADGATCGHIRAATATIKQLLAADSADGAQER